MLIKGKSLDKIENNTKYYGCVFYLENSYSSLYLKNCSFDNCSFRSDVFFDDINNCTFDNCSFGKDVRVMLNHKREVPQEILSLPFITHLDIGAHDKDKAMVLRNFLDELPTQISQLPLLRELILDGNHLRNLPKEIGNLTHLSILKLDGNKLSSMPKEIGELTSLVELSLSSNQLKSIPREIGNLKNLQYLYLDKNRLTSMPQGILQLTNLSYLSLAENSISQEEVDKLKVFLPNCRIK